MSRISGLILTFATMVLAPATAFACVCVTMGFSDSDARSFYNERKFDGAIFTGKIRSIRDLPEGEPVGDGLVFPLRELVIEVEQYWFGVEKAELKAITLGGGTSCTVEWQKDRSLFFIARGNERGLNVGSCDLSNWRGTYPDAEWAEYTRRILGPSKSFKKNVKKVASMSLMSEHPLWTITKSSPPNPVNVAGSRLFAECGPPFRMYLSTLPEG